MLACRPLIAVIYSLRAVQVGLSCTQSAPLQTRIPFALHLRVGYPAVCLPYVRIVVREGRNIVNEAS